MKEYPYSAYVDNIPIRATVWALTRENAYHILSHQGCTNIVLDDRLVQEAFKYATVKTKRGLVDQALREFIDNRRRLDVRKLRGKVRFHSGYDYKKLRVGKA